MNCLLCRINDQIVPHDIVFRGEHVVAVNDVAPLAHVHLIVFPKRHVESIFEINADEQAEILVFLGKVKLDVPDGFRMVVNEGTKSHREFAHAHIQILAGPSLQVNIN